MLAQAARLCNHLENRRNGRRGRRRVEAHAWPPIPAPAGDQERVTASRASHGVPPARAAEEAEFMHRCLSR
jgi:hypothetical protein